jgi:hypothetical protein
MTDTLRKKIAEFWDALPEDEKAWFSHEAALPCESIIDIDESGSKNHTSTRANSSPNKVRFLASTRN